MTTEITEQAIGLRLPTRGSSRMSKLRPHIVACAIAVAMAVAGSAHAALLTNGGFESPSFGGFFLTPSPGTEPVGFGWAVTVGNVEVLNGSFPGFPGAYAGIHSLDLVGTTTSGGIAQTFATTAGTNYSLSFAYANNPGAASGSSANVSVVNGVNAPLLSTSITHATSTNSNLNWTIANLTFQATGSTATLSFTDTSHHSGEGIYLDAITVADVPEPASFALLGAGLLATGFARRRTRA